MKLFFIDIQATVDVMEVMSVLRTYVSGCSPFYGGRNMIDEANPGGTWCPVEWGCLSRCMY
jgi:hypothetical protein